MKIAVVQSPRMLRGILRALFGLRDRDHGWDDRHHHHDHHHHR